MTKFAILILTLSLLVTCLSAAPHQMVNQKDGAILILDDPIDDDQDMDNSVLSYDPKPARPNYETSSRVNNNRAKASSYVDLERESSSQSSSSSTDNKKVVDPLPPTLPPVRPKELPSSADAESSGSPNIDKIKTIAFNSREVRLVGPQQKEVEMKDDVATKVIVALDNLQKEATEVWGQVNDKLDKGWTDLKRSEVWGQINDKLDKGWTDLKGSEVWGQVNDKLDKGWTDLKKSLGAS